MSKSAEKKKYFEISCQTIWWCLTLAVLFFLFVFSILYLENLWTKAAQKKDEVVTKKNPAKNNQSFRNRARFSTMIPTLSRRKYNLSSVPLLLLLMLLLLLPWSIGLSVLYRTSFGPPSGVCRAHHLFVLLTVSVHDCRHARLARWTSCSTYFYG